GGEGESNLRVDVHLVDTGEIDFRRVLGRRDVGVLAVENVEAGVQRDGLAATGGAGHQDHALGLSQILLVQTFLDWLVPQRIDAEHRLRGVQNTQHDLLAEQRGAGAHAEVDGAILRQLHLDAPILRDAALGDVQSRHDFQAGGQLSGQGHRGMRDLFQDAVHAQPDAKNFLVGLEVNIRGAAANGVQHHLVDEPDDGRVFDIVATGALVIELLFAADGFEGVQIHALLFREGGYLVVDLLDGLVDGLLQLVVLDDDGLDAEARLELDFVDRVQVGRVGDRQEQTFAAAEQRQYTVLGQQLVVDQAYCVQVQGNGIQIEQRYPEFVRGGHGDIAGLCGAAGDQLRDYAHLALTGDVQCLQHDRFLDDPVLYEPLRQATQARARPPEGQRSIIVHGLLASDCGPWNL